MKADHALKADVLAELAWDPMVDADHIGVTVRDGLVTLTGHAESYWQKRAAETAVGRVKGVKAIAEAMTVSLPLHVSRSDEEIARQWEYNVANPHSPEIVEAPELIEGDDK